jgi:ketosteroid isomerase-like protein
MAKAKGHLGSANEIEAAFYEAIGRADLDAMMALWADDEEIVCVHPGGLRLLGHAAIRSSWESIFKGGGVPIHPVQMHATHSITAAVHSVAEEVYLPQGQPTDFHVIATNVYLKTPSGWRIVAHHASVAAGRLATTQPPASGTLH